MVLETRFVTTTGTLVVDGRPLDRTGRAGSRARAPLAAAAGPPADRGGRPGRGRAWNWPPGPSTGSSRPWSWRSTAACACRAAPTCWCCPRRCRWRSRTGASTAVFTLEDGETVWFGLHHRRTDEGAPRVHDQDELGRRLDGTIAHLAVLGAAAPALRRSVARSGPPQRQGPPGADVRTHRRHRGRGDHVAAGVGRRGPQLGLPLLVGAGCQLHSRRPLGGRLPGRGRRVLHLHLRRGGGTGAAGRRPPDHVRRRRGARPDRAGAAPSGRMEEQRPCPHRQRCVGPAPARRVRRVAERGRPAARGGRAVRRRHQGVPGQAGRRRRRALDRARPGDLGGAGRPAALPVLEAHVLGGARQGHRAGRRARRHGPGDRVEAHGRRDRRRHPGPGLERRCAGVHPGVRSATTSTRRC